MNHALPCCLCFKQNRIIIKTTMNVGKSLLTAVLLFGTAYSQNLYAQLEDPAALAKKCGERPALALWNALNEFSSLLPYGANLYKAGVAASKVANKETSTDVCGMNMANLITMMSMVAKKEIFENDLKNLSAQWDSATAAYNQMPSMPGNDFLETLAQRLDVLETECATKDFRIRPVLVGTTLLKLHTHRLLIDSANKSFDDRANTNSYRFYFACARAIAAAEASKAIISKLKDDYEGYINKTHYILDEKVEDSVYTGQVIVVLPDGSYEYGPDLSCAVSIFFPNNRPKTVRELQQLGEKLVRERIEELRSGENADQRAMFREQNETIRNIDSYINSINKELASRNEALKKYTTGGATSHRAVDGVISNGDPAYSFVTNDLDWQVDLGRIWNAFPNRVETVAFKAVVKKSVNYKIQLLDTNKKMVVGCERIQLVKPGSHHYAVNFRAWPFGAGKAPVARYVKIESMESSANYDYNLDEVYVFTADVAPTMQTWQSTQSFWFGSERAVDLDAKDFFGITSSLTTAVPGKKSNWVGYLPHPLSVGKVVISSSLDGGYSYLVQLVSEENVQVASTIIKSDFAARTHVWNVPLSANPARSIRITTTDTNKQVGLYDVRIFKRGE
jgi:hypothetical protein